MTQVRRGASENQRALREAIKALIVDRGLSPGAPLPTETELMRELSVSRHPLREAIKALEALGIVEVRHGYGTYVGSLSLSPLEAGLTFRSHLSLKGDLTDIRNLVEVREALEVGLVFGVLAHRDELDYPKLERAVATMEEKAERGEFAPDEDWLFHQTLYERLGNDLVNDLLRVFWTVYNTVNGQLPRGSETPVIVAGWHRRILDAVRSGDPERMMVAVREHFGGIRERIPVAEANGRPPSNPA